MSNLDVLLITPPSRTDVYEKLAEEYAAIEPPVWSSLIANYLLKKGYSVKILDAESLSINYINTLEKLVSENYMHKPLNYRYMDE